MQPLIGYITFFVNGFITNSNIEHASPCSGPMLKSIYERIKSRLDAVGMSATEASEQAGLSRDAIRNIKRAIDSGRSDGVSSRTLAALAPVLQTTASWLLEGDFQDPYTAEADEIPVAGTVQAGIWREVDSSLPEEMPTIPVSRNPRFSWARQYALEVVGDSMDMVFAEGQFVIVIALGDAGIELEDGMLVICERLKAGLREVTVKRLRMAEGQAVLQPESSNPKHEPIVIDTEQHDDDTTISVTGVVIGRYEAMI